MSTLRIGTRLQGKYEIKRLLGQGGFGVTYLAHHALFDEDVAVKEFFPKNFCDRDDASGHVTVGTRSNRDFIDKLRDRFIKEARNLRKLKHPGIVEIYDIFEENDTAYYVMKVVEGSSMQKLVDRSGPLSEAKAIEYIRKVGDALAYIHDNRMTHLDVKPDNIMLDGQTDQPVLIDFGLSKQYAPDGSGNSSLLQAYSSGYSAKEQYSQGALNKFSPQSDIYSLGATLLFLLTGETPPESISIDSTDDLAIPSTVSATTAAAIRKAMASKPANRFSDTRDFTHALATPEKRPKVAGVKTQKTVSQSDDGITELKQPGKRKTFGFNFSFFSSSKKDKEKKIAINHVAKDYSSAVARYLQAAEQGNAVAQNNLGSCYYKGDGVAQNYSEALKWYRKAAKQGDSAAQANLGLCYFWSRGVAQNYSEAVKWFRKAAGQGEPMAQSYLGGCYLNGNGVTQNYREAVKWLSKAAEQGNIDAQTNLGYCYSHGKGVAKNFSEAVKWYRKAAERGGATAQNNLGFCYERGNGVAKNLSEAVKWYRKAAAQGLENAIENLRKLGKAVK